jgi:hypothetical protein
LTRCLTALGHLAVAHLRSGVVIKCVQLVSPCLWKCTALQLQACYIVESGILTTTITLFFSWTDSTCLGLLDHLLALFTWCFLCLIIVFVIPFLRIDQNNFWMSRVMSTPLYTCWASADDWQPGFVILGANVKAIPTPPPQSPVIIGADGSWGAHEWTVYPQLHHHEFPYLTWIPLRQSNTSVPSCIHTPVDKLMWQYHPDQPNIHVISPTLLHRLTQEWESVKAVLQDPSKTFSSIQYPKEAYLRALTALIRLEKDFGAWRDFVKVFRNFQQLLLELFAFLDWWRGICTGSKF